MKLLLIVTTPEDDDWHYPRINQALLEYTDRVRSNHLSTFSPIDDVGIVVPTTFTASNGVTVYSNRIDYFHWWRRVHDALPKWLRWIVRRLPHQ